MSTRAQRLRRTLAALLVPCLGLSVAGTTSGVAHAAGGTNGSPVTLQSSASFSGYDALTTADGTTYVGWIGNAAADSANRQVHLCILHVSSSACVGGVQTVSALSGSAAQNLKIVNAGGDIQLVWIAQASPSSGDFSAIFGDAHVVGASLQSPSSITGAPTYGTLMSVLGAHDGSVVAAVSGNSTLDNTVYYYSSLGATPKGFTRPYFVGNAQLADNGHQTVLTTSQYGSLSGKVSMASKPSSSSNWSSFSTVAHSYTGGGIERLQNAGGHIELVSMSDRALYTPYIWRWNGSSLGDPTTTGDHHDISSIDTTTDGSHRLATVSTEVGNLTVSNFGTGKKAALFHIGVKETFAGGSAQLTTSASGTGWVIYGIQKEGVSGDILRAQRIHLAALTKTVHAHGPAGKVTLVGPASCMPVSSVGIKVSGKPATHWKLAHKIMHLGSHQVDSKIVGAKLKPHHSYTLKGTVTFARGGHHSSVTAQLSFTTCARP